MRTEAEKFLLNCIRYDIFGEKMPEVGDTFTNSNEAEKLFRLAMNHDLMHIVSDAVYKNGISIASTVSEKLVKNQMFACFRSENAVAGIDDICNIFEKSNTPYILLKGASMLQIYPEKWMRTCCDIDVFVGRDNFDKALEILKNAGYSAANIGSHDVHLKSNNGVEVELHFDFMDEDTNPKIEKILNSEAWKRKKRNEQGHWVFDNEMLYFFHLAHLFKHFKTGGCGIKFVVDTFLLRQKLEIDISVVNKWLEEAGIKKFNDGICGLADYWFDNAPVTQTVTDLEYFFFHTTTYGDTRTHCAENKMSKPMQILCYIFLPYDKLRCLYPKLRRHRWMYIYYVFKRLFSRIFGGKLKIASLYLSEILAVKDNDKVRMRRLFKEVGLDE